MKLIVEMKTGMVHNLTTEDDVCFRCLARDMEEDGLLAIDDTSGETLIFASDGIMSIRVIPETV